MANIVKSEDLSEGQLAPEGRRWRPLGILREMLRWDPFGEIDSSAMSPDVFAPRFDVKETRDAYVFRADLPGVKEEDLAVTVTGRRLTVDGKREHEERAEGERYFTAEVNYGRFSRSFTLPPGADGERVDARLRDGVLQVTIPKTPEVQPRKVPVEKAKAEVVVVKGPSRR